MTRQFVGQISSPGKRPQDIQLTVNERGAPTSAEAAAGIKAVNPRYKRPGDIRRHFGGTSQSASINDKAIANALLASDLVIIPQDGDGSTYDITSSFTLARHGQRVVGEGAGNIIATTTSDAGPRLNVVSGFPTTGGDAAQSVFNLSNRNQSVENVAIDCNNIADIGIYGTGGSITRCALNNVLIQDPAADGIKFFDSTFMNSLDNVTIASPGGYGVNIDATSGSSGHTTYTMDNVYVTSAGTAGFRFDAVSGFVMNGCGCDSTDGYAVVMVTGCQGVINGMDTEQTEQLFDLSDQTNIPQRLVVNGSRFLGVGNATPVSRVIYNGGHLEVRGCSMVTNNGSTAFLETRSNSTTVWQGNTDRLEDLTNTINNSSQVIADNSIHTSNNSTDEDRFRIESASNAILELLETGDTVAGAIEVDGGKLFIQRINATTKGVNANMITLDLDTGDVTVSGGSSGDTNIGASSGSLGFHGATAVAKQTVTGSTAGNAALQDLLTKLATLGLDY